MCQAVLDRGTRRRGCGGDPEVRARIKQLLVAGHSGNYIARRVGLRKRAYDNHVAAIKAELGASNLVQLGVLLAGQRNHWSCRETSSD